MGMFTISTGAGFLPSTVSPTTCYRQGVHIPTPQKNERNHLPQVANSWLVSVGWWTKSLHEKWLFHQTSITNLVVWGSRWWRFVGGILLFGCPLRKQYYWYEPRIQELQSSNGPALFFALIGCVRFEVLLDKKSNTYRVVDLFRFFKISNSLSLHAFLCEMNCVTRSLQTITNTAFVWSGKHVSLSHEDLRVYTLNATSCLK